MGTLAAAFGVASALSVDPHALGTDPVSVELLVPGLEAFHDVPLMQKKWVTVTASTHSECSADPKTLPKLTQLGVGVLTTREHGQVVQLPRDANLALIVESTEQVGGNTATCAAGLRFHSEAGKHYRLRFLSPQHWHWIARSRNPINCVVEIVELVDDRELPVPTAHLARTTPVGVFKGGDLNVCAEPDSSSANRQAGDTVQPPPAALDGGSMGSTVPANSGTSGTPQLP